MDWRSSVASGVCVLLSFASATGCGEGSAAARAPYPLVGRWVGRGHKVVLEFLADGTMAELRELEARRSTRQADGTFKEETVPAFECHLGAFRLLDGSCPRGGSLRGSSIAERSVDLASLAGGSLEYDLTRVGGLSIRKGILDWRIDPAGHALTLRETGVDATNLANAPSGEPGSSVQSGPSGQIGPTGQTGSSRGSSVTGAAAGAFGGEGTFEREDTIRLPEAEKLIGLWRRVGNPTLDYVNMGIRFTPGGIAIVIGKNCPWDGRSGHGTAGWLCMFTKYEVGEGNTLREVRPGPDERRRTRTFQIEGDRLTFPQKDLPGHVYQRVHGVVPLENGVLNVRAWNALE